MDLQRATDQYVDMLKMGSRALQRLGEDVLDQNEQAALRELMADVVDRAQRISAIVAGSERRFNNSSVLGSGQNYREF